jgi:hypothetical protein
MRIGRRDAMRLAILVLGLLVVAGAAGAAPITIAGFTFPAGEQAFADDAFLASGTIRTGSFFTGACCTVAEVLSGSDISTGVNNNTGDSGIVEVRFTDNAILNGPGDDLVIFELSGPLPVGTLDPRERFGVSVFAASTFTPFLYFDPVATGVNSGGDPTLDVFAVTVDLSIFGVLAGESVDRLQLHIFDVGLGTKSADVAALGVIPEPGTAGLLGFGLATLSLLGRRRRSSRARSDTRAPS